MPHAKESAGERQEGNPVDRAETQVERDSEPSVVYPGPEGPHEGTRQLWLDSPE